MPYRLNPKDKTVVQKKVGKVWQKMKKHPNTAAAKKHLTALKINVKH